MYLVESKGGAIACMLVALLFLGTWPAILALLERRGRLPQHTYLDYSFTNLLAAVVVAFTVGQIGESKSNMPNFTTQLFQVVFIPELPSIDQEVIQRFSAISHLKRQIQYLGWVFPHDTPITYDGLEALLLSAERRLNEYHHHLLDNTLIALNALRPRSSRCGFPFGRCGGAQGRSPIASSGLRTGQLALYMFAMAGGVFLSLGNLATQYAFALVGLSVTEVITSSVAVVLGTTLNYFLDNRINRAEILFPGVACFLIAVCLGSAVHYYNAADNAKKLQGLPNNDKAEAGDSEKPSYRETVSNQDGMKDSESGSYRMDKARVGSANYLIELEETRAIKVFGKSISLGLSITFFAGVSYSLFSPAFNLATNDQWHVMKEGVPHLVVYAAFFYFSLSFFAMAVILNVIFLYHPVLNLPKSSIKGYLKDWNGRNLAFLAGLLCGLGNGLQFMGGQAAGYAAADCVQALPLVSTFWAILFFGEYRRSSKRTYALLVSMLCMFMVAVAVLIASSGQRKTE
ncbi:Ureide permease 2 [Forsythia ovata]|uniref:Ureide permease 2 n=1 Tax=Forsythia ovata TaxID=205694 RepID=A0ABD1UDB5_9LAMI